MPTLPNRKIINDNIDEMQLVVRAQIKEADFNTDWVLYSLSEYQLKQVLSFLESFKQ